MFVIKAACATEVDEKGEISSWGYCGPDCPFEEEAWLTDDTLTVHSE